MTSKAISFPPLNFAGSSGSAGTAYRLDSQDSTASVDGDAASSSNTWNSGRQPSVSLREWDIPYEDLTIGEMIGPGRFSTGESKRGANASHEKDLIQDVKWILVGLTLILAIPPSDQSGILSEIAELEVIQT